MSSKFCSKFNSERCKASSRCAYDFYPGAECERFEAKTNFDKLKELSVEQFADWLCDQIVDRNIAVTLDAWIGWLNQLYNPNPKDGEGKLT